MVVQIDRFKYGVYFFVSRLLLLLLAIGFFTETSAQKTSFKSDMKFVDYLKERKMFVEAQYILTKMDTSLLTTEEKDSMNFAKGVIYLLSDESTKSICSFDKVSEISACYSKALVANAYNYWQNKQYDKSDKLLKKVLNNTNDSGVHSMALLMLSANELLQNHPSGYANYAKMIDTSDEVIQSKKHILNKVYQSENAFHHKSPVVAGVLSAVVPGLGKWYLGKPNEAFGAFIPLASLGILTYEAYRKGGVKSLGFVSFASLFSVFYAGNIWGSMVSVKIRTESFNNNNEKNIALGMLVPINRLLR